MKWLVDDAHDGFARVKVESSDENGHTGKSSFLDFILLTSRTIRGKW